MRISQDVGIDLGTATVLVHVRGKGIVLKEPAVIAVDKNTKEVLAVGNEAKKMLGRTPKGIETIRPIKDGVVSDYVATEKMLKYFLNKVSEKEVINPRVMICIPSGVTEVEKKAVITAANNAGARQVHLIEETLAAAIGAGIDITKPKGTVVIDVGGGTTDVAVVSLGGIVKSQSIRVAGDKFDEAIIKHIKKNYNVIIGENTAEKIKVEIGTVYKKPKMEAMKIRGRSLISGLPIEIEINSYEINEALSNAACEILEAVYTVMEKLPPELCADITETGIYLTGGGALIYGLDKLIEEKTGLKTVLIDKAESCVAIGTGKALEHIELIEKGNTIKIKKM
ncbi:MAG: rod shape-determining protein [Clostridia bacterium]|nr:rod shape-determining protein [Clostridia bacterium]